MKVKIAILAVVATVAIIFAVAFYGSSPSKQDVQPTEKTAISKLVTTTDTEKTEDTPKNNTNTNKTQTNTSNKSSTTEDTKKYKYFQFSTNGFKSATGDRVIFFYKEGDDMSMQVNKALADNFSKIKDGVIVFRADYDTYKELAGEVGVTQPGTLVRFNSEVRVTGMFVASYKPTIEQIKNTLDI